MPIDNELMSLVYQIYDKLLYDDVLAAKEVFVALILLGILKKLMVY